MSYMATLRMVLISRYMRESWYFIHRAIYTLIKTDAMYQFFFVENLTCHKNSKYKCMYMCVHHQFLQRGLKMGSWTLNLTFTNVGEWELTRVSKFSNSHVMPVGFFFCRIYHHKFFHLYFMLVYNYGAI